MADDRRVGEGGPCGSKGAVPYGGRSQEPAALGGGACLRLATQLWAGLLSLLGTKQ